jgi:hypothetical protein
MFPMFRTVSSELPGQNAFGSQQSKFGILQPQFVTARCFYHLARGIEAFPRQASTYEDCVEKLISRYVKRDEILLDRVRRMDEAEKDASK